MAPNQDIDWDQATPVGNDRKVAKCNYCAKIVHGGITRMKQHIGHVAGQVEACQAAPRDIRELLKKHLIQGSSSSSIPNLLSSRNKRAFSQSFKLKEEGLGSKGVDPYIFLSKNNAGTGIKGPIGKQIGDEYLNEEMTDVDQYIRSIKHKWKTYRCTIMCDGWSTWIKHPIINFMVYCDRDMIYHSFIDCTNKVKTVNFVLSLMDKVVDSIGEENIVQIVTNSESSMKAAGEQLMKKRKHLFWSPCAAHCINLMLENIGQMKSIKDAIKQNRRITSFIYNSDKVVNLMKAYTNNIELLRPSITRFATEFIVMESLLCHATELK
ncbi:uncharacterized protein [Coffea arabica]|uniref:BED-type domain-containing protein n=1 Tax=Coffea arabica TaxID=13443 RepID=A0A6P6TZ43_COFAR|nr:uncharacterized protein LOC113705918 [Coffea arabica]